MNIKDFLLGYEAGAAQGGGSSADVRYVTFMSHDGTVELGKKAVAVGDDCADPIARGIFETPTKESTAQYNYSFVGWATTPDGAWDEAALDAVSEDRTVYAAYAAAVRNYTITYYDGTTVLKTETLAYGSTPSSSYTPTKSGYSFAGWEPSLATVTGNASYTAVWKENITFAGGAWADIAAISEAGQAASYFSIGQTKTITVGDASITLRIIGFNHDTLADGSGKAGMTIFAEQALSNTMTAPNWSSVASKMKTTIKPQLPAELQAVIKPVLKQCDATTPTNAALTPSSIEFELFPLSWDELGIKRYAGRRSTDGDWRYVIAELGTTYSYFSGKYNSTYSGPYVAPWYSNTGSWFRQYFRTGTSPGIYNTPSLTTSSPKWGTLGATSDYHPVLFAFCV